MGKATKKKKKQKVKLRGGLDPNPPSEATGSEALWEYVEAKRDELRKKVCSAYWIDEIVYNGTYSPAAHCNCRRCKRRGFMGWPAPVIMSCGMSFECFLERTAKSESKRKVTEKEAMDEGLSIIKRFEKKAKIPPVLVSGCFGCDGLRPKGDKYCLQCKHRVQREMRESGYLE